MSLTGSRTGGRAILRLTGRSERKMENINMGGQISFAVFGQFSFGVYTDALSDLYLYFFCLEITHFTIIIIYLYSKTISFKDVL